MNFKRTSLALAVVSAATLGAVSAAGAAAQAAPAARATVLIAPPAPERAVSAATPTISPAARQVRFVAPGQFYNCDQGNLCVTVWDPTVGLFKIFDLYQCRTYTLSNWFGAGLYWNAQTGGAVARFYDGSWRVVVSAPVSVVDKEINWDPLWYIRNC